jgi:hypothetical protein
MAMTPAPQTRSATVKFHTEQHDPGWCEEIVIDPAFVVIDSRGKSAL